KSARSLGYTLTADAFSFVPLVPFTFEAENLLATALDATLSDVQDNVASGGALDVLTSVGIGEALTLTTTSVPAGTYTIQFQYKRDPSAGQHTITVDGMPVGGVIDQYGNGDYVATSLGALKFTAAGVHVIQLKVTGKNNSSS